MNKISATLRLLCLSLMTVACSPQAYNFSVQMRYPSDSGLDIADKSVAVVYMTEDGSAVDSLVSDNVADGLARGLEADFRSSGYQTGVDIYKMSGTAEYGSQDSLVSLVMKTGADVVILLGHPECGTPSDGKMPCRIDVRSYDSMAHVDTVWTTSASAALTASAADGSMLSSDAQYLGYNLSKSLVNKWKDETYSVVYYDSFDSRWLDATEKALSMNWHEAMDVWMKMLDENRSATVKSGLAYNIALACYMVGDYRLAQEWLDMSDSIQPLSLSSTLRSRVQVRMPRR